MRLIKFLQQGGLVNDPNKIQSIINKYGNGKSPFKASDYVEASKTTGVPVELLLAQGILESNLGTKGMAVRTHNVGNVGNNGNTGKTTNHGDWKNGLMNMAKLLKNDYKAQSMNDVQRLISNNFLRPTKGGRYAEESNYGQQVAKIINNISNTKFSVASPAENTQDDYAMDFKKPEIPKEMFQGLNDWDKFSSAAKKNPDLLNMFSPDLRFQFEENTRLENERLRQEQRKSEVEYENQQIQLALQEKQQQREQILSMVPQAQSINSGQIKAMFEKGGTIRKMLYAQAGGKIDTRGRKIFDKAAKENFANALKFEKEYLNSKKIRERIKKSGLDVDDELERLGERLNAVNLVVDESGSNANGASYNEPSDEIRYSYSSPTNVNQDTMSHEVGHIFGRSNIRYSNYIDDRNGLIEEDRFGKVWQKLKLLTSSDYRMGEGHEADWQELVADVHSAREELRNVGYDGRFSNFNNKVYNDMRKMADQNPDSAVGRIFNKIGPSESIKYRSMKSYYDRINPNEVPKEHKDFMKDYENNKQKYEDTQKRYIFDVMNKIVLNENTNEDKRIYVKRGGKL